MQWTKVSRRGFGLLDTNLFVVILAQEFHNQVIAAASEAATIAALRVMQHPAQNSSHSHSVPPENPGSDGAESETDGLKPFKRMCSQYFLIC